jgi:hypothetical protein
VAISLRTTFSLNRIALIPDAQHLAQVRVHVFSVLA